MPVMEPTTETLAEDAPESKPFYAYMFEPNKKPTQQLELLLKGLGKHIIENIGDKKDKKLSPAKLAAFYKAVGGNYDSLFIDVPQPSISYIYQSIGCQHTLQPTGNDFEAPQIPALTIRGFVRWESIETLLDPEEHVPYLLNAIRNFALVNPETGEPYPVDVPASVFPSKPDPQIQRWHKACAEKLRDEAIEESDQPRDRPSLPPRPDIRRGYTHLRPSFSPGREPRERRGGADFFDQRPVSFQHVHSSHVQPTRPQLSRSTTRRTYLAPEARDEEREPRIRRRSVPDNYHPASPLPSPAVPVTAAKVTPSPGSDSQPPQDTRKTNPRRHSHPRPRERPVSSSSSSSSSESEIEPSSSVSPQNTPPASGRLRKGPPHSQSSLNNLRFGPGGFPPLDPKNSPYRARAKNMPPPEVRVDPRLARFDAPAGTPVVPDPNVAIPFGQARPPPGVRFPDGAEQKRRSVDIPRGGVVIDPRDNEKRRREDVGERPKLFTQRSGSHDGRYGRERKMSRDRERGRDRNSDKDERDITERRRIRRRDAAEGVERR